MDPITVEPRLSGLHKCAILVVNLQDSGISLGMFNWLLVAVYCKVGSISWSVMLMLMIIVQESWKSVVICMFSSDFDYPDTYRGQRGPDNRGSTVLSITVFFFCVYVWLSITMQVSLAFFNIMGLGTMLTISFKKQDSLTFLYCCM